MRKLCVAIATLTLLCVAAVAQQKVEKSNMELVGYNDLQARSSYQPTLHKQGNRWYAYIGHHGGSQFNPLTGKEEDNGTSIVDVTDPKQPKYVAHIPGEPRAQAGAGAAAVAVQAAQPRPRLEDPRPRWPFGRHCHRAT